MTNNYKHDISNLFDDPRWDGFFRTPLSGTREYPLNLSDSNGKADFCYEFQQAGKLFLEDDDAPRAINNLIKYWRWCLEYPDTRPVHLIHVIGDVKGIQIQHCRFLKERMEHDLSESGFKYHIVTFKGNWGNSELWLPAVKDILVSITGSK